MAAEVLDMAVAPAETVVDGVAIVLDSKVGKCGIAWKITKCLILFALTLVNLVTGVLGLKEFRSLIRSYRAVDRDLLPFLWMWMIGYVSQTCLGLSLSGQIVFSVGVIREMHIRVSPESSTQQKCKITKWKSYLSIWSIMNYILSFVFSDIMVGLSRVLIAFKLPAQVSLLQTPIERLSSIVAFTVTCIQILLLTGQLTWNLVTSKKRTGKCCSKEYLWDIFALFLTCMALAPPAMSMFIAIEAFSVEEEFVLNLPWLIAPPFGLFVILLMLVSIIVGCTKSS